MKEKILQDGAEALIILEKDSIVKRRIKKSYRLEQIDEKIRKLRTRSEGKIMNKVEKIVPAPKVLSIDENKKEIKMTFIQGDKLSDHLNNFSLNVQKSICKKIGENIAKLHDKDIIHGDLTTSNMIYVKSKNRNVFMIDFGLSFISHKAEDKAVDIHLLKQALEAKHFKNCKELFNKVLEGYSSSKNFKTTMSQFEKVEKRGRYKAQY